MGSTNSAHHIYIQPSTDNRTGLPKFGNSGPLYDASYSGKVIVRSSHQPFLDACRVLLTDGMSGPAEIWDHVRPFPRMRSTIEAAAKLRVSESGCPPRFRPYLNGLTALVRRAADGD